MQVVGISTLSNPAIYITLSPIKYQLYLLHELLATAIAQTGRDKSHCLLIFGTTNLMHKPRGIAVNEISSLVLLSILYKKFARTYINSNISHHHPILVAKI
jgi:hypothetical protein